MLAIMDHLCLIAIILCSANGALNALIGNTSTAYFMFFIALFNGAWLLFKIQSLTNQLMKEEQGDE